MTIRMSRSGIVWDNAATRDARHLREGQSVTLQDVADRLIADLIPQIGQRPTARLHANLGQIVRSDRSIGRSPNSRESWRNSTNTSTRRKTVTSAQQRRR
jgi:antitoxin (DNA-binding transcriptional repressor) of toxin-antitoxin stability system